MDDLLRKFVPNWWSSFFKPASTLTDAQKTTATGIELDDDFAGATIGKIIPVFVGGEMLAGCKLIEGPFLSTVDDAGYVNYIVSPFAVAVPEATRELSSIRLNGTESFTSGDGGATWTEAGAAFSGVTINVLYGTETQTPFASSVDRYGARAVPYRSHVCIELQVVPLAPFANLIPFASVFVHQDDYLTRKEGIERLARYARYNDEEFEIEVSSQDDFWIVVKEQTFIEFLQDLQRTILRNCNICATDKLRVFENSSTETPIEITKGDVAADSVRFWQDPPETVPAQRTLGFVDTGRDYDFNSVTARRSRFPIPLTASQDGETIDIPIGMGAPEARIEVNRSLLIDHIARDKCSFKLLPHMMGVEPGDIVFPNLDADINWPTGRVISVARNAADFTSDVVVERIEMALLPTGPSITSDSTITVDEEDGVSVVTVTSDQEGTFSIAGGDDAALFTIDPDTGVLEFLVEPDYEDPQDADNDNDYEVIVQVLADGLTGTQLITVTVADVIESGASGSPIGLLLALTNP
jgi:hypothetical protein